MHSCMHKIKQKSRNRFFFQGKVKVVEKVRIFGQKYDKTPATLCFCPVFNYGTIKIREIYLIRFYFREIHIVIWFATKLNLVNLVDNIYIYCVYINLSVN